MFTATSTIEPVLSEIQASYFSGKHNRAIHRDMFPWATSVRWGELNDKVKQSIITTFSLNLMDEILQLQPQVVIFGIEDDLAKTLLPELTWQLLHLFKKGSKIRINKAWGVFKSVRHKKILFIQSTPARYPFSFLDDTEKALVGSKIQQELVQHHIQC